MEYQYTSIKTILTLILIIAAISFSCNSCNKKYVDNSGNIWEIQNNCIKYETYEEPAYMPITMPDGSTQLQYYVKTEIKCVETRVDTVFVGKQKYLK